MTGSASIAHLAFYNFSFLLDTNTNCFPECLRIECASAFQHQGLSQDNACLHKQPDDIFISYSRHTCVNASVLDISRENISEAAIMAKGVASPRAFAMPIAIAVLPVPGCPANRTALPAILPSLII